MLFNITCLTLLFASSIRSEELSLSDSEVLPIKLDAVVESEEAVLEVSSQESLPEVHDENEEVSSQEPLPEVHNEIKEGEDLLGCVQWACKMPCGEPSVCFDKSIEIIATVKSLHSNAVLLNNMKNQIISKGKPVAEADLEEVTALFNLFDQNLQSIIDMIDEAKDREVDLSCLDNGDISEMDKESISESVRKSFEGLSIAKDSLMEFRERLYKQKDEFLEYINKMI